MTSLAVQVLTALAGVSLVALATWDAVATVVAVGSGRGPLTRYVSRLTWKAFLAVHRRRSSHRVLGLGGPTILLLIIATWVVLTVAGWALIFGSESALAQIDSDQPVPGVGRVYYAASLVVGRGSPVYRPTSALWQGLEQVAAANGVALFSLGIAYVIPVVNAVVNKRRTAAYISTLGHTPEQILTRAWTGDGFGTLRLHLIALAPLVSELAERHLAYPVLFHFHSIERHTAAELSLAVLDETVTLLDCCVEEHRLEPDAVIPLRGALGEFLDTLHTAFIDAAAEPVPDPPFGRLRDRGVPLAGDEDVRAAFDRVLGRRRLLRALVEHDGWTWQDISAGAWTDGWSLEVDDPDR